MLLLILAYLGGVLTIASPCILPVLPFVFARADQPFLRSGLPLLAGMALTFALVATLAAVGGGWIAQANIYGRWLAIALLAVFGLTLLLPRLSDWLMRPIVGAGNRLSDASVGRKGSFLGSLLLGVATGLLWAPCAGPILGLVLTAAALQGASVQTTFLLAAYAAGAACSLAAALLLGGRVFAAMKRSIGGGEWIRRAIGAAMLGGVLAISLGWDTGVLAQVSTVATGGLEQSLVNKFGSKSAAMSANDGAMMRRVGAADPRPGADSDAGADPSATMRPMRPIDDQGNAASAMVDAVSPQPAVPLPDEGPLPPLDGAVQWLNSPPLTAADLRGKVVLIDFWTYSCINCLRTLPFVTAWAAKYKNEGLVVIGVHSPEFAFERQIENVTKQTHKLGIDYPVAIDNHYTIWRAFNNEYWPAQYFIDASGRIRYHHFGEGDDEKSEQVIQQLLREAGHRDVTTSIVGDRARGVEMAADGEHMRSPETYVGYARASGFASPGGVAHDVAHAYATPLDLSRNQWGLSGRWKVGSENAILEQSGGKIRYRFHARDLHLVLGSGDGQDHAADHAAGHVAGHEAGHEATSDAHPVHIRVTIDGHAPGADHGADIAADGTGVVDAQRLYQLVRQSGPIADRTFEIEFLDPGAEAYAFTFG